MNKSVFFIFAWLLIFPAVAHDDQRISREDIGKITEATVALNKVIRHIVKPNYGDKKSLRTYAIAVTCTRLLALFVANLLTLETLGPTLDEYKKTLFLGNYSSAEQDLIFERLCIVEEIKEELEQKTKAKIIYHIELSNSLNACAFNTPLSNHIAINEGWLIAREFGNVTLKTHLRAVLFHEIGHLWHNHILKNNIYLILKIIGLNFFGI